MYWQSMSRLAIHIFLNCKIRLHCGRWVKDSAFTVMPFWTDNDKTKTLLGISIRTKSGSLNTRRGKGRIIPAKPLLMVTHKAVCENLRDRNDQRLREPDIL